MKQNMFSIASTDQDQPSYRPPSGKEKKEDQLPKEYDLDDDYEDMDYNIYFNKWSILNFVDSVEDDNLFKIKLIEQEE